MMSLGATRDSDGAAAEGNWTEYMKAFSGKLYRPDVAPADMNGDQAAAAPEPEPVRAVAPAPIPKPAPAPAAAVSAAPVASAPKPKPVLTNPLFEAVPPRKN
jgi:hypothetical protein